MMVQGGDCKNIVVYYEWIRDACTHISAIGLVRNLVALEGAATGGPVHELHGTELTSSYLLKRPPRVNWLRQV